MNLFLNIIYLLFFLLFLTTYFFVIYHLVKYSIGPFAKMVILPMFATLTALLLLSNVLLFFSVDWNYLISKLPL